MLITVCGPVLARETATTGEESRPRPFLVRHAEAFPATTAVLDAPLEAASRGTGQIEVILDYCAEGATLVVVDIGATWCTPCRHRWPQFVQLASESRTLRFASITVDADAPDGRSMERYVRSRWNSGRTFGLPSFAVLRADGSPCGEALYGDAAAAIDAASRCGAPAGDERGERAPDDAHGRIAEVLGSTIVALDASTVGEVLDTITRATGIEMLASPDVRDAAVEARATAMPASLAAEVVLTAAGLGADVIDRGSGLGRLIVVWRKATPAAR